VLLALFAIRVIAQPLSLLVQTPLLPPFASWYSGVVPYPLLLVAQIVILIVLTAGIRGTDRRAASWSRRTVVLFGVFGALYFVTMALRLVLGTTILQAHPWFGRTIPAFFHLVLASYVLVYADFHIRSAAR
jgi:hypothetical protein